MPNWCNNTLSIYGTVEDVVRFKKQAIGYSPWHKIEADNENALNFHSFIPVPADILASGYDPLGYEWELANWGSKWGACHSKLLDEWEGHLEYAFDTAWTPPLAFLTHVAPLWPSLIFLLEYEEMGMGFKGLSKFKGDEVEDHCVSL